MLTSEYNSSFSFRPIAPRQTDQLPEYCRGETVHPHFELIHHAFEQYAKDIPEAIAAIHQGQQITYGELNRQANNLAGHLLSLGVQPGDNVGLFLKRSIPMLAGIIAILKTGAAYVPQDIRLTPEATLRHIIRSAGCRIILTQTHFVDKIPGEGVEHCIAIEEHMATDGEYTLPRLRLNAALNGFILFTSGTTGTPNGVQVSHANICNIILTEPGRLGIGPGKVVSQLLNIAFDMAAWEILGCLTNGGTLLIRGSDFEQCASQAHVIIATPSVLARINRRHCTRVITVAVAGEPCPRPLADSWAPYCDFYNCCGPTETTIVNSMQLYRPESERLTIGKPTANNTIYVLDKHLQLCLPGEVGEMWGGGACVTGGYINNHVLTEKRYRPDPFLGGGKMMFCTGDLGRWTTDGELEHLGRVDDQVKIRGFRVELDAVSSILEKTPGCLRAVTLKRDDQHLIAFVTPVTTDVALARELAVQELPYYAVPEQIIALEKLPVTARGKVDKRLLRENIPAISAANVADRSIANLPEPEQQTTLPPPLPVWRRLTALPWLEHYHLLYLLVSLINLWVLGSELGDGGWWSTERIALESLSGMVVINLSVAILIRQSYIINGLFWLATRAPVSWPLSIRRHLAKVYHFGGIHTGCATAATIWLIIFTGSALWQQVMTTWRLPYSVLVVSGLLTGILTLIVVMALPPIRRKYHNKFELVHRFAGWTALILFWLLSVLMLKDSTKDQLTAQALLTSAPIWAMTLVTMSVILPWLRLHRVDVQVKRLSDHAAAVTLRRSKVPFPGSSNAVSRSPLKEWHSFANIPAPGQQDFRLIISRAGDWTGEFINNPPKQLWLKSITTAGVANIETLFKSVVYIATGSGVGPVLPHLLAQQLPMKFIWSTRNPRQTYGDELVDEILAVQPDTLIWDTDKQGKPDLLQLAWQMVQESQAEAVICIANKKLTDYVVRGCEARGIPAYGAIWDS